MPNTTSEHPIRFGAAVPVANDTRFLRAVTGQLLKVCDRVLVLRSLKSFSGLPIVLEPLPLLDPRVKIIECPWESEGDVRNSGIEILSDCEFVFIVDADEIYTTETLNFLKSKAPGHRALACYMHTYWKTPRFEISPPEHICATICVHKDTRFRFMRVLDGEPHIIGKQLMHHLSYVRTDEEMVDKIRLYAHAHQISARWYENVWKKWQPDMLDIHPINPGSFHQAKPVICEELEAILNEYGVT